jgi:hypothetical protein
MFGFAQSAHGLDPAEGLIDHPAASEAAHSIHRKLGRCFRPQFARNLAPERGGEFLSSLLKKYHLYFRWPMLFTR